MRSARMMRIEFCVLAMIFLLAAPAVAQQNESKAPKWLLHSTVIGILPTTESNALDLSVANDASVAADLTYFVTPHLGINLLATFLDLEVNSAGKNLGAVKVLPPILTVQWHFLPKAKVRPYVGVGMNYNIFFDKSGALNTVGANIENQFGFVAQAGLNYMLTHNLALNLDAKYLRVDTTADTNLGDSDLTINAPIIGAGLGYYF